MVNLLQKCNIFFIASRNHDAHVKSRIERINICKLQKGCTRLTPASDRVRRWFSLSITASSIPKTGRHDINLMNNQSIYGFYLPLWYLQTFLMTSFIPRTMHVQISKLGIFFYFNAMV